MGTYSTWERPWAPLSPVVARVAETWFDPPDGWAEGAVVRSPLGLLVGEQPGPSSNPKLPMWPYPPSSAGGRLHRMSGVDVAEYLVRLARVNLARRPVARWNAESARQRGYELLRCLPDGARVVACGARPASALGTTTHIDPVRAFLDGPDVRVVGVPHPSGRNREYNDPAVVARARMAVRWAAGLEEWTG